MAWIGALMKYGIPAAASLAGGAVGSKGSKDAAKIQAQAAQQQLGLQREIYNSQLQGLEPWRATGQGANNLLAQLYGLPYMDYSPTPMIGGGYGGGSQEGGNIPQKKMKPGLINRLNPGFGFGGEPVLNAIGSALGFGPKARQFWQNKDGTVSVNGVDGGKGQVSGTIDPSTGVFTPIKDPNNYAPQINNYLQTGKWEGEMPGSVSRTIKAINALRGTGWDYSQTQASQTNPDGSPVGYHEGTGKGDLSVFQNSPGYNFRLNEGLRAVQNSAAARGGLGGGNSLRAVNDYAQGTASDDFYNFVNQMNNMSGRGQTAVGGQQSAGTNFGIGAGSALGNYGDARASGVMGAANSWGNAFSGIGGALSDYWSNRNSGTAPNNMQGLSPYTVQSQYKPVPGQSSGQVPQNIGNWYGWRW